jgi:hypothetical protein
VAEEKKTNRAEILRRARQRTQVEILRKTVDYGTGSKGRALVALTAAVAIPTANASGLLDLVSSATDLPIPEAGQARKGRKDRGIY